MSVTINRHTSEDLRNRRDELAKQLTNAYSSVEKAPITRRDLRDLASMIDRPEPQKLFEIIH